MSVSIKIATLLFGCILLSSAGPQPAPSPQRTLSVLYFENRGNSPGTNDEYAWVRKGAADTLISFFSMVTDVTVVERERLEALLTEQELSLTGLVDEKTAPTLGKLLSADILVSGSFVQKSGRLILETRTTEVQSGRIVASTIKEIAPEELFSTLEFAGQQIARSFGWAVPAPGSAGPIPALAAARTYYQGLDLADSGNWQGASALFLQASQLSPLWLKPGASLEKSYQFLKQFRQQRQRREINSLLADIQFMRQRLTAPVFYNFGDMITTPTKFGFADASAASAAYQKRPRVYNGDTPVQAAWHLQHLLTELAGLAVEYFADQPLHDACQSEIMTIAVQVQSLRPDDPFLPEVLYMRLMALIAMENWSAARSSAEEIMLGWPDYRMNWAVENFYEKALEKLGAN